MVDPLPKLKKQRARLLQRVQKGGRGVVEAQRRLVKVTTQIMVLEMRFHG